jgi:MFS family permease
MSHVNTWPSSLRLELEARRMLAEPFSAGLGALAPALVLGRLPVFFDAFAFALAAVLVFPHTLFARLDLNVAMLCGLAFCGLAFVVRPLGGWLASEVDRRHGRGVRLTAAQFVLGASTAAIAFLPDRSALGAAAVLGLLGCCRLVQGVAAGGAGKGDGAVVEAGGAALVSGLAALLALGLAGGLFAVLTLVLTPADFLSWGWRYPFVIAVPMNIVALFAQLRLLATDANPRRGGRPGIRLAASRES